RRIGARTVACASTGNTSASLAAYAARAGMKAFVFIPAGQVSLGKLSQTLDYGATLLQIEGDFDDAMRLVREAANFSPTYLLNSVNPFRLEGQKTIAFELMQQRGWNPPDRVVVPGGNLGNSSAIAKGFHELLELGLLRKMPKLTIVQAEGANPLYRLWLKRDLHPQIEPVPGAFTLATAIKIGSPISWPKAVRALQWSDGNVEQVSEQEIADAKAIIGRDGIGCEPASAVTLAGIKKMVLAGEIKPAEDLVAILTGHLLKDPDYTMRYHTGTLAGALGYTGESGEVSIEARYANAVVRLPAERGAIIEALGKE
ncbi:MAG: threonine synthase, partial [Blastocatellia bacterium]|nr:threonine synthase [Blastocatellia bacterium]